MPEPITTVAVTGLVGGASMELGRQIGEKYGPSVIKATEDGVKAVGKAVDEGLQRDLNAGGISSKVTGGSSQTA
jgi:hypothetical protein